MLKVGFILAFLSLSLIQVAAQSKKARIAMSNALELENAVFGSKDSVVLKKLFSKSLVYIHSSGKTENYDEAIRGVVNNKSTYAKDAGLMRYDFEEKGDSLVVNKVYKATETKADGSSSKLSINIETVWAKEKVKWKLYRRQATKVE